MVTPARYLVTGSADPIRIDLHGPIINPGRYRGLKEAEAEAARLIRDGWRGVAILDGGAVTRWWPMCRQVTAATATPDGRSWPTHWCGRHDLCEDGRCPEHTTTGGRPVETADEPDEAVQLDLFTEVAR